MSQNEIALREPKAPLTTGGSVAPIVPTSAEEAHRMAKLIIASELAPETLKGETAVLAAIVAGMELGLPPMAAVQSIAVINGRPSLWGDGFLAVVRRSPLCLYVQEWIEGEGDAMQAVCETHRDGEPRPIQRTFSVADAKKAGLWSEEARVTRFKKGGQGTYEKDNDSPWYRYPKRMLQMRARAWCLRDVYADVLKGLQMAEEVRDYVGDQSHNVTPRQSRLVSRIGRRERAQVVEPDQPDGYQEAHVSSALGVVRGDDKQPAEDAAYEPIAETGPTDELPLEDNQPSILEQLQAELAKADSEKLIGRIMGNWNDKIEAACVEEEAHELAAARRTELREPAHD